MASNRKVGRYAGRGASASKSELHKILAKDEKNRSGTLKIAPPFASAGDNLFAQGILKFLPQGGAGSTSRGEQNVFLLHSDGSGSKAVMAYLYWRETGDLSGFRAIAEDALVMNSDDLMAVGAIGEDGGFAFTSMIDRNHHRIPAEVLASVIAAGKDFCERLTRAKIPSQIVSGETADLGESVRTLVVNATAATWVPKKKLIDAGKIAPGAVIVGLASDGKTTYEGEALSGIGSNGLTSARHDLLTNIYRKKYPETTNEATAANLIYCGRHHVTDTLDQAVIKVDKILKKESTLKNSKSVKPFDRLAVGMDKSWGNDEQSKHQENLLRTMTVGQALLSPTRTYLPVIRAILDQVFHGNYRRKLQAIFHLTGGGQTKCLHFGRNIHYIKDNLFPLPPIFYLLAEKTPLRELYQVYNCGHRLELIVANEAKARQVISLCKEFDLRAQIIGRTEAATSNSTNGARSIHGNCLTLKTAGKKFFYT